MHKHTCTNTHAQTHMRKRRRERERQRVVIIHQVDEMFEQWFHLSQPRESN
jgi:hypothetical protein